MDIQARAASGDTQAQIALAQQHQNSGHHDLARGWFARAAQSPVISPHHAAAGGRTCSPQHPIMMHGTAPK